MQVKKARGVAATRTFISITKTVWGWLHHLHQSEATSLRMDGTGQLWGYQKQM